jgi:hypothetical protein
MSILHTLIDRSFTKSKPSSRAAESEAQIQAKAKELAHLYIRHTSGKNSPELMHAIELLDISVMCATAGVARPSAPEIPVEKNTAYPDESAVPPQAEAEVPVPTPPAVQAEQQPPKGAEHGDQKENQEVQQGQVEEVGEGQSKEAGQG